MNTKLPTSHQKNRTKPL